MPKIEKCKSVRKRSNCWLFFNKTDKGGSCRICKKDLSSSGNTTNLINHMKRVHTTQWEALDFKDFNERPSSDSSSSVDEEEVDSDASYRPPKKETRQTYQSADGRTIFWLPENVQIDQIAHPHMMVVGETSGNVPESTNADSVEQKEETFAATEAIENKMAADHHEQENGEQDGNENGQKADTFVVQLYADQVAQQEDGTGADQTAPRNSPRKVVVSHASSSHKLKKDHSKKRPKNSHDDRESFLRSGKRRSHLIEDSPERDDVFNGQNTSRIRGDLPKDDPFDHFGKYIASLLRNLPNKRTAVKLQRDILNLVLKEQLFYET